MINSFAIQPVPKSASTTSGTSAPMAAVPGPRWPPWRAPASSKKKTWWKTAGWSGLYCWRACNATVRLAHGGPCARQVGLFADLNSSKTKPPKSRFQKGIWDASWDWWRRKACLSGKRPAAPRQQYHHEFRPGVDCHPERTSTALLVPSKKRLKNTDKMI
jgi:hypothetical protein